MKYLILIFLSCFNLIASDWNMTFERLNFDHKGMSFSDESIVIYGTGSMLLYTNDSAKTWKRICIHNDTLDIKKIINVENEYFGILNDDYLIKGSTDAKTWNLSYIEYKNLTDIATNENDLFILQNNEILRFNIDFEYLDKLILNDSLMLNEILFYNNRIIGSISKSKLVNIDYENGVIDVIDLQKTGLCDTCLFLGDFKVYYDSLFINLNGNVLKTGDLKNWFVTANNLNYFDIHDHQVYEMITENSDHLLATKIGFFKKNGFLSDRINKESPPKNIDIMKLTKFNFINDSLIIGYGKDKLLISSTNGGVDWNILSFFPRGQVYWLNDSIGYNITFTKGQVFRTSDFGITWSPSNLVDNNVIDFKFQDLVQIELDGRVFIFKGSTPLNKPNLIYSTDFGKTFKTKFVDGIYRSSEVTLLKNSEGYLLITACAYQTWKYTIIHQMDSLFNYKNHVLLDSFQILEITNYEDHLLALAYNKKFPYNLVQSSIDSLLYCFLESYDHGLTWQHKIDFYMKDTLVDYMRVFDKNTILLHGLHWYKVPVGDTTDKELMYIINPINGERESIFVNHSASYYPQFINRETVIGFPNYLYVNPDIAKDNYSWYVVPVPNYSIGSITKVNNYIYFGASYLKTNSRNLLLKVKFNSPVEVKPEKETASKNDFMVYPNPTDNYINVFSESGEVQVFDILGVDCSDKLKINKENPEIKSLVIDISKLKSGVYIIKTGNSISKFVKI